jgi:HNH endonuclease
MEEAVKADDYRFAMLVHLLDESLMMTPCHYYTGPGNAQGYGLFTIKKRTVLAHRWWWQQNRALDEALVLDHLCGVRRCVNLEHLEPVTQVENMRRAKRTDHVRHLRDLARPIGVGRVYEWGPESYIEQQLGLDG